MNRVEAISEVRRVAKQYGYAIATHGTLERDVDLVAVPWIEGASSTKKLVKAITDATGWHAMDLSDMPHGRKATILYGVAVGPKQSHWTIDLSIMPRRR